MTIVIVLAIIGGMIASPGETIVMVLVGGTGLLMLAAIF